MASVSAGRTRLVLVLSLLVLVAAVVAVALVWGSEDSEGEERSPEVREAVVVDDLCAVVEPLVPTDLGLGKGRSETGPGDESGTQRATCTFGSPRQAALEVQVTTYAVPEGDPDGTLDQLVVTACDAVEEQYPAEFTGDERGCSGQDAESTTEPVLVTANQVGRIETRNAIVSVELTDQRLPAQVAAYASSITYGVVSSNLEAAGS